MSLRVVIADDEKVVNDLVKMFIEQKGFEAFSAFSGAEAIELVEKNLPEIIILDIGLPDMTGLEVVKRIRPIAPNIKIIITTGYRDDELEEQAQGLGINQYVKKPFAIQELINEILALEKTL
jgi:DNA-binding response OmpR family regulator